VTSPTTARRRPPGRYDEPGRLGGRVTAVVLGLLFAGALAAIAFALFSRFGVDRGVARVIDFQVVSDSAVVIDVEVVKPAGSPVWCLLRSRGEDGAEVGREVVMLAGPGDPERVVRREHELATTARAVTGETAGCRLEEPVTSVTPAP
jgi:hypothetical protein